MKLGAGSLKELIRLINPWPDLSKREKTQIDKIMNVKEEITTNTKKTKQL